MLGVGRGADRGEVKTAFRKLARELHPDVNDHDPEAEEKFKEAAEAYEVLSDPERRRVYDAYGHEGLRGNGFAPGAGFGSIDDIFQAFFSGQGIRFGRARADARPGPRPLGRDNRDRRDAGGERQGADARGRAEIELPRGPSTAPSTRCAGTACRGRTAGRRGDMVIVVHVLVPSDLSEEQEELARKLGESLEPSNLRSAGGGEESFFSRVRRAFG